MLVMEYMQHGTLYELLQNNMVVVDGDMVIQFANDISTGMNFLHSCKPPLLHKDLTSGSRVCGWAPP